MAVSLFRRLKQGQKIEGPGEIIVGTKARQPMSTWRKTYIVGCMIVIIGSCIASYFLWRANSHARTDKFDSEGPVQSSVLHEAVRDDHAGRYDDEAAVLKNYLKSNPPQKYRYEPLISLANIAYNDRQYAQVIEYNKQAEAAAGKVQEADAVGIAEAAQAEGDKATAIYYYKQAIKLTQVQPGVANSIDDYKAAIKYLGGTP